MLKSRYSYYVTVLWDLGIAFSMSNCLEGNLRLKETSWFGVLGKSIIPIIVILTHLFEVLRIIIFITDKGLVLRIYCFQMKLGIDTPGGT